MTKNYIVILLLLILCHAFSSHTLSTYQNSIKTNQYDDNDLILTLNGIPFNTYDRYLYVTGKLRTLSTFKALHADVGIDFPNAEHDPVYLSSQIILHADGIVYCRATLLLENNAAKDRLVWLVPVEDHVKELDIFIETEITSYPIDPVTPHLVYGMLSICPDQIKEDHEDVGGGSNQDNANDDQYHPPSRQQQQLGIVEAFYITYLTQPFAKIFHYNSYCSNQACTTANSFEIFIRQIVYPHATHPQDVAGGDDDENHGGSRDSSAPNTNEINHIIESIPLDLSFAIMSGGLWRGLVPDTLSCLVNGIPILAHHIKAQQHDSSTPGVSSPTDYPVFLFKGIRWTYHESYRIQCQGISITVPSRFQRVIVRVSVWNPSIPYYHQPSNSYVFSAHYAPKININYRLPILIHKLPQSDAVNSRVDGPGPTPNGTRFDTTTTPLLEHITLANPINENNSQMLHNSQNAVILFTSSLSLSDPIKASDKIVFCLDNAKDSPHTLPPELDSFTVSVSQSIFKTEFEGGKVEEHQIHVTATMQRFLPPPPPEPSHMYHHAVQDTPEEEPGLNALHRPYSEYDLYHERNCLVAVCSHFRTTFRDSECHENCQYNPGLISLSGTFNITISGKISFSTDQSLSNSPPQSASIAKDTMTTQHVTHQAKGDDNIPTFKTELGYFTTMTTPRSTVVSHSSDIQPVAITTSPFARLISLESKYTRTFAKEQSETWIAPFSLTIHEVYDTVSLFDLVIFGPFWLSGYGPLDCEVVPLQDNQNTPRGQDDSPTVFITGYELSPSHYSSVEPTVEKTHIAPLPDDTAQIHPLHRRIYRFQTSRLGHSSTGPSGPRTSKTDKKPSHDTIFEQGSSYTVQCSSTYLKAYGHFNFRDHGVITIVHPHHDEEDGGDDDSAFGNQSDHGQNNDTHHDASGSPHGVTESSTYQPIYRLSTSSTTFFVEDADLSPRTPVYYKRPHPITLTFIIVISAASVIGLACIIFLACTCPKKFCRQPPSDDRLLENSDDDHALSDGADPFGYNPASVNAISTDYFTFHNDDMRDQLFHQHNDVIREQYRRQQQQQQQQLQQHHQQPMNDQFFLHCSPVDP